MRFGIVLFCLLISLVLVSFGCQQRGRPPEAGEAHSPGVEQGVVEEPKAIADSDTLAEEKEPGYTVAAYYFHRTARCPSCLAIEALASEAIDEGFKEAVQGGDLIWTVINIDEDGGREFEKEFGLETSTLVVAKIQNGRHIKWKKLQKVWELLRDRDAFVNYVQKEVAEYLN